MKRLILVVLIISVVSLGACVEPAPAPPTPSPTPTPETAPEPMPTPAPEPELEESLENRRWIASQLRDLHNTMPNLITKYPIVTWEDYLIHNCCFTAGGWGLTCPMLAVRVSQAKTHIDNAYCLTNESRLPDETKPRDVSVYEINAEVVKAIILLEKQVSYSYSCQEDCIEWVREIPTAEIQRHAEYVITDVMEFYDEYREELSRVITKLQLIQSRLPKDDIIFSIQ